MNLFFLTLHSIKWYIFSDQNGKVFNDYIHITPSTPLTINSSTCSNFPSTSTTDFLKAHTAVAVGHV